MEQAARERFQQMKEAFLRARAEPPDARARLLDNECGHDIEMRAAVERLLRQERRARKFLRRKTPPESADSFSGTDRFEVRHKIGSGGFGDVYAAFDRKLGLPVALKVLRQLSPAAIYRFKREFRALDRISHSNICRIHELIFDPECGRWLLVMELVDGLRFFDHLRTCGTRELRGLFGQIAAGVSALHQAGILHCDLKPSNVLVTREGRVVLVDFGLAKRFGPNSRTRSMVAGTPDYVAPEQIGGAPISAATDWYSVGVMLYRALCGRLPFTGNAWEVVTAKQKQDAPPFEIENATLEDLRALCMRMVQRQPSERPPGEEILRTLHLHPPLVEARGSTTFFVGRDSEMQSLFAAYEESTSGHGLTLHIHGASGMGKTAFVRESIERLRNRNPNLFAFTGTCYEGESVPYKALDEVVEGIGSYLESLPIAEAESLAPRQFLLLAKLFPSLEPIAGRLRLRQPFGEAADPRQLRRQAFAALRELLARLSDRRPLILFIDDLQWGDYDSAVLLREVMDDREPPPILLMLSYRDQDYAASPCLQSLRAWSSQHVVRDLEIGLLQDGESEQLAAHLLGPHNPVEPTEIAREAGGSPFFLQQLAIYVREGGTARRLPELIQHRMDRLPETARQFLEVLAVARTPLRLQVVREVACLGEQAVSARSLLCSEGLIRLLGPDGEFCDVYHDRIAEALAVTLSNEQRSSYHTSLAAALERSDDSDAESIAHHFRAAGRIPDACRLIRRAAEQASGTLAFDRAARLYQTSLEWSVDHLTLTDRAILERARADALVNCGRGVEAARAYERAITGAPAGEVVHLRIRVAAELLRSGEIEEGAGKLRELLQEYRIPLPKSRFGAIVRLVWERLRLRPWGLLARREGQQRTGFHADRLDVCWAAAIGFGWVDPLLTEIYCSIYLRFALQGAAPRQLALAYGSYASRLAYIDDGRQLQTRGLMSRAERYARQEPSPYVSGFLAQMWAVIELLSGNWRKGEEHAQTSLKIYGDECTGVAWETASVISHLCSTRAALGRWRQNALELPGLIRDSKDRGDRFAEVSLRLLTSAHLCQLIDDDPDGAEKAIEQTLALWPRRQFDIESLYAVISRVDIDLYRGESAAAWTRIQSCWRDVRLSGLLRITLIRVFAHDSRARAALAEAARAGVSAAGRDRLLGLVEQSARTLERCASDYPKGMAFAIQAGVAGLRQQPDVARQWLLQAEAKLAAAELAPWLAVTQLRLAALLEGAAAEQRQRAAMAWIRSQQIRRPECLVRMLFPGS